MSRERLIREGVSPRIAHLVVEPGLTINEHLQSLSAREQWEFAEERRLGKWIIRQTTELESQPRERAEARQGSPEFALIARNSQHEFVFRDPRQALEFAHLEERLYGEEPDGETRRVWSAHYYNKFLYERDPERQQQLLQETMAEMRRTADEIAPLDPERSALAYLSRSDPEYLDFIFQDPADAEGKRELDERDAGRRALEYLREHEPEVYEQCHRRTLAAMEKELDREDEHPLSFEPETLRDAGTGFNSLRDAFARFEERERGAGREEAFLDERDEHEVDEPAREEIDFEEAYHDLISTGEGGRTLPGGYRMGAEYQVLGEIYETPPAPEELLDRYPRLKEAFEHFEERVSAAIWEGKKISWIRADFRDFMQQLQQKEMGEEVRARLAGRESSPHDTLAAQTEVQRMLAERVHREMVVAREATTRVGAKVNAVDHETAEARDETQLANLDRRAGELAALYGDLTKELEGMRARLVLLPRGEHQQTISEPTARKNSGSSGKGAHIFIEDGHGGRAPVLNVEVWSHYTGKLAQLREADVPVDLAVYSRSAGRYLSEPMEDQLQLQNHFQARLIELTEKDRPELARMSRDERFREAAHIMRTGYDPATGRSAEDILATYAAENRQRRGQGEGARSDGPKPFSRSDLNLLRLLEREGRDSGEHLHGKDGQAIQQENKTVERLTAELARCKHEGHVRFFFARTLNPTLKDGRPSDLYPLFQSLSGSRQAEVFNAARDLREQMKTEQKLDEVVRLTKDSPTFNAYKVVFKDLTGRQGVPRAEALTRAWTAIGERIAQFRPEQQEAVRGEIARAREDQSKLQLLKAAREEVWERATREAQRVAEARGLDWPGVLGESRATRAESPSPQAEPPVRGALNRKHDQPALVEPEASDRLKQESSTTPLFNPAPQVRQLISAETRERLHVLDRSIADFKLQLARDFTEVDRAARLVERVPEVTTPERMSDAAWRGGTLESRLPAGDLRSTDATHRQPGLFSLEGHHLGAMAGVEATRFSAVDRHHSDHEEIGAEPAIAAFENYGPPDRSAPTRERSLPGQDRDR